MPPRMTRNSDRPRASDRTMVDIVLLAASFTLDFATSRRESLREWDHKRNIFRGTKQSGLDLENKSRSSGRGGAFFLTSLFIELIDLDVRTETVTLAGNRLLVSRWRTANRQSVYKPPSIGSHVDHGNGRERLQASDQFKQKSRGRPSLRCEGVRSVLVARKHPVGGNTAEA